MNCSRTVYTTTRLQIQMSLSVPALHLFSLSSFSRLLPPSSSSASSIFHLTRPRGSQSQPPRSSSLTNHSILYSVMSCIQIPPHRIRMRPRCRDGHPQPLHIKLQEAMMPYEFLNGLVCVAPQCVNHTGWKGCEVDALGYNYWACKKWNRTYFPRQSQWNLWILEIQCRRCGYRRGSEWGEPVWKHEWTRTGGYKWFHAPEPEDGD